LIWVLDSSAILASFLVEPGSEYIDSRVGTRFVSAVNLSEVATKLIERGISYDAFKTLGIVDAHTIIDFDLDQALLAAKLRPLTKRKGLSLGDRACLALAIQQVATVLTADRAWAEIDVGVKIEVVR
jgi:ribonuclease VapC